MRVLSSPIAASKITLPSPRVLVPTMGALHTGHLALLKKGRALAGKDGALLASIFVNPIQFGPNEDLAKYPRPRRDDLNLCRDAGVDLVFAPEPAGMYAPDHSVFIDESQLSSGLCGAARAGHFQGVCTVVGKLFNILQPQIAVFGEKDYQQLAVIRRMVRDLNFPVKIVALPTVREADGLALSSRNRYLSAEERASAPVIRQSLLATRDQVQNGESGTPKLLRKAHAAIEKNGGRIDYIEIVDAETLKPQQKITSRCVIAAAVFFGKTRLIDNCLLVPR
ncbi:MAG TPA: pantoate--beta-alanine ligase [Chthoniobacterales bacterium]